MRVCVIEPSMSELAAPILFIKNNDAKLRFCIDYMKLNSMAVRNTNPFSTVDQFIDTFSVAQYSTILHAYVGYWQVNIRIQDQHKTHFDIHTGTFHFISISFGLTNVPTCLQRALALIFT